MTGEEDIILIPNILSGNHTAQKILYDKYRIIVKNYLKHKYSNYSDIDDDVSEIMIKVFYSLNSFDNSKSKFKSWVISIAKNYMIDKWRCNTITLNSSDCMVNFSDSNGFSISNNADFTLNDNVTFTTNNSGNMFIGDGIFSMTYDSGCYENCSSVNYISEQLSPQDFTLLDMKYIQGYDYCEIGKEFNLTSTTVSNKVNYIKTKIKKNYSKDIYD